MEQSNVLAVQKRRVLAVCVAAYTVSYLLRTNLSLALEDLMEVLSIGRGQAGLVSTLYFWTYASGQLLGGWLSVKWDPKRVVALGLAASGLCNLAIGFCSGAVCERSPAVFQLAVLGALTHHSRLTPQAAYRAKIFRGIFQKCSRGLQGLSALFGSFRKKFSGALHHLKWCVTAPGRLSPQPGEERPLQVFFARARPDSPRPARLRLEVPPAKISQKRQKTAIFCPRRALYSYPPSVKI